VPPSPPAPPPPPAGEPAAGEEPPGDLLSQDEGDTDLEPFTPPLDLTLDPDKKKKYRAKWDIDQPDLFVGVTNSGEFLTNFVFNFSDLLGDQRVSLVASSVTSYTNFDLAYYNLGGRWDWGARIFDYRDFYVASDGFQTEAVNRRQRYSAVSGFAQYPFNRYLRFETSAGYVQRRYDQPFFNPSSGQTEFVTSSSDFPYLSVGLVYDSVRYQGFGPYQGKQIALTVSGATFTGGDFEGENLMQYTLDTRFYQGITQRSLLALRLVGLFQSGNAGNIYSIGGINEIRGYEYNQFFGDNYILANLELRFPLFDSMRLPFGLNLAPVRGFIFVDFGTMWFGDQDYVVFDEETGLPTGIARGKATYSEAIGTYRQYQATLDGQWIDYHGSVGAGFTVPVFGLPLTWAFSRVYTGNGFESLDGSFYIIINW
jgi:outer membrane protein assembly factor BamA